MIIAAVVIGSAIRDFRLSDRFVEVKGLAEREVAADLAIWPIAYQLSASSLESLNNQIAEADEAVIAFLKLRGFTDEEITASPPRITDQWLYSVESQRPASRYTAERGLTLKSNKVEATLRALQESSELIGQGVVLTPNWGQAAQFLFTGLNAIKPEMIAEATADARRAANQFAADSDATIGPIRSARQGFFSINERDPSTPEIKVVRVVTTIEYVIE
ncbi:MAG: SIMPL domain-containing protein [Pseudomonadota bacterium]